MPPTYTEHFQALPPTMQDLVRYVTNEVRPRQVILFGSRARGDHRQNSDFDIAVKGPIDPKKWTELIVELEEKNLSLYPVDVVQFEGLADDYKKNISVDGKLLYG